VAQTVLPAMRGARDVGKRRELLLPASQQTYSRKIGELGIAGRSINSNSSSLAPLLPHPAAASTEKHPQAVDSWGVRRSPDSSTPTLHRQGNLALVKVVVASCPARPAGDGGHSRHRPLRNLSGPSAFHRPPLQWPTTVQRLLTLAAGWRTHADWHQAAIEPCGLH